MRVCLDPGRQLRNYGGRKSFTHRMPQAAVRGRVVEQHPTIQQPHGMLHKRSVLGFDALAKATDHTCRRQGLILKQPLDVGVRRHYPDIVARAPQHRVVLSEPLEETLRVSNGRSGQ